MKTSQFTELIFRRGMRTKLNLDSSTSRRIAGKLAMSGVPLSSMPLEWLDAGSWRLPSGKALAEFALQAGFLAPPLFNVGKFGGAARGSKVPEHAMPARAKQYGKGSGQ
jgi:hypothetical protein